MNKELAKAYAKALRAVATELTEYAAALEKDPNTDWTWSTLALAAQAAIRTTLEEYGEI